MQTKVSKIQNGNSEIGTKCLICGDFVSMEYPNDYYKICDDCRESVKWLKELMKGSDEVNKLKRELENIVRGAK